MEGKTNQTQPTIELSCMQKITTLGGKAEGDLRCEMVGWQAGNSRVMSGENVVCLEDEW